MKRLAFLGIILCLLLVMLVGCDNEDVREFALSSTLHNHPSLMDNVYMIVTDVDKSENRIIVTIINNSEYELIASYAYMLEFFDDTDWRLFPWLESPPPFPALPIQVYSHDSIDFTKNLRHFEPLTPGRYRIRKNVYRLVDRLIGYDENDSHDVIAEFHWE